MRQRGHDTLYTGPEGDHLPTSFFPSVERAVRPNFWSLRLRQVVAAEVRVTAFSSSACAARVRVACVLKICCWLYEQNISSNNAFGACFYKYGSPNNVDIDVSTPVADDGFSAQHDAICVPEAWSGHVFQEQTTVFWYSWRSEIVIVEAGAPRWHRLPPYNFFS